MKKVFTFILANIIVLLVHAISALLILSVGAGINAFFFNLLPTKKIWVTVFVALVVIFETVFIVSAHRKYKHDVEEIQKLIEKGKRTEREEKIEAIKAKKKAAVSSKK